MVRFMEKLPDINLPLENFPDSSFMVPRIVLICDNLKQKLTVVNCVPVDTGENLDELYQKACQRIDGIIKRLRRRPLPYDVVDSDTVGKHHRFIANMSYNFV